MIIQGQEHGTQNSITILVDGDIRYNETTQRYYVPGRRLIKSTGRFSKSVLIHCLITYNEQP